VIVRAASGFALALMLVLPRPVVAQAPSAPPAITRKVDAEGRADGIFSRTGAVHFGVGFTSPLGTYTRPGVDAALGFSRHGLSGRVDLFTRFHFDPFRQSRWAPYGGGGISGRFDKDEKARAYLLVFVGIDGPVHRGMSTSFEAGLGGGARFGVIIRQARPKSR
jgi:hypothetical protein